MIGFLPKLIALGAALLLGTWSWIRRAFELLTPKSLRPQSQHLAMDIYLTTATNSLKLFQTGPLSVYRFFHRHDVSRSHELEYLSYVRHHRWGHDKVKPYGLLRIDEVAACDLPSYEAVEREIPAQQ